MYQTWTQSFPYALAALAMAILGGILPIFGPILSYFSAVPLYIALFHRSPAVSFFAAFFMCLALSVIGLQINVGFWLITLAPIICIALSHVRYPKNVAPCFIFHRLSLAAITFLCVGFMGFWLTDGAATWVEGYLAPIEELSQKMHFAPTLLIRFFPGILMASWVLMAFGNYMFAFMLAPKMSVSFKHSSASPWFMPPIWDIPFICGLLFVLIGNHFNAASCLVFGISLTLFSCFPLLILGFRRIYTRFSRPAFFWIFFGLSFMLAWPLLFVVLSVFIEPWLNKQAPKN